MGGLDGMVLNIGTFGKTGLDNVSVEEWNRIYDVNVRGPMLACREALPRFENGGSIVFISSIAALRAGSQMAVYDSSKAALGGLMRNIAHVGARRGIRANLVYPGLVDTPNGRTAGAGRPSRGKGHIPFGRQATAWEIAYAVLFFISEESAYITAQTLAVDSGLSGM
jgi:NAD(P)-dependent dehydrogenase (short-subunit alcohol dehydrogenase family)